MTEDSEKWNVVEFGHIMGVVDYCADASVFRTINNVGSATRDEDCDATDADVTNDKVLTTAKQRISCVSTIPLNEVKLAFMQQLHLAGLMHFRLTESAPTDDLIRAYRQMFEPMVLLETLSATASSNKSFCYNVIAAAEAMADDCQSTQRPRKNRMRGPKCARRRVQQEKRLRRRASIADPTRSTTRDPIQRTDDDLHSTDHSPVSDVVNTYFQPTSIVPPDCNPSVLDGGDAQTLVDDRVMSMSSLLYQNSDNMGRRKMVPPFRSVFARRRNSSPKSPAKPSPQKKRRNGLMQQFRRSVSKGNAFPQMKRRKSVGVEHEQSLLWGKSDSSDIGQQQQRTPPGSTRCVSPSELVWCDNDRAMTTINNDELDARGSGCGDDGLSTEPEMSNGLDPADVEGPPTTVDDPSGTPPHSATVLPVFQYHDSPLSTCNDVICNWEWLELIPIANSSEELKHCDIQLAQNVAPFFATGETGESSAAASCMVVSNTLHVDVDGDVQLSVQRLLSSTDEAQLTVIDETCASTGYSYVLDTETSSKPSSNSRPSNRFILPKRDTLCSSSDQEFEQTPDACDSHVKSRFRRRKRAAILKSISPVEDESLFYNPCQLPNSEDELKKRLANRPASSTLDVDGENVKHCNEGVTSPLKGSAADYSSTGATSVKRRHGAGRKQKTITRMKVPRRAYTKRQNKTSRIREIFAARSKLDDGDANTAKTSVSTDQRPESVPFAFPLDRLTDSSDTDSSSTSNKKVRRSTGAAPSSDVPQRGKWQRQKKPLKTKRKTTSPDAAKSAAKEKSREKKQKLCSPVVGVKKRKTRGPGKKFKTVRGDVDATSEQPTTDDIAATSHMEGADELPTINPPKQRKGKKKSSKPVPVAVDVVSPGLDAERLSRDFPLHNWLENKINELKNAGTGNQKKPYLAGVAGGASKKMSDKIGVCQTSKIRTDVSNDKSQTGNGENGNSVAVSLPCLEYIVRKNISDNTGDVCQYTHNCADVSRDKALGAAIDNGNLGPVSSLPRHAGVAFYASAPPSDNTSFCKITQIRTDVSHDEAPVGDTGNGNIVHVSRLPCNTGTGSSKRPSDNTGVCHYTQNGANVPCETLTADGDNGSSERMTCLPDTDLIIAEYHSDAPETLVQGPLPYSTSAKEPRLTPSPMVVSETLHPGEPPALIRPDESDVVTDTMLIRYNSVKEPKATGWSIAETPVATAGAECMAALVVMGNVSNKVTERGGKCDDTSVNPSRSTALSHATTGKDILAQLVEWSRETSGLLDAETNAAATHDVSRATKTADPTTAVDVTTLEENDVRNDRVVATKTSIEPTLVTIAPKPTVITSTVFIQQILPATRQSPIIRSDPILFEDIEHDTATRPGGSTVGPCGEQHSAITTASPASPVSAVNDGCQSDLPDDMYALQMEYHECAKELRQLDRMTLLKDRERQLIVDRRKTVSNLLINIHSQFEKSTNSDPGVARDITTSIIDIKPIARLHVEPPEVMFGCVMNGGSEGRNMVPAHANVSPSVCEVPNGRAPAHAHSKSMPCPKVEPHSPSPCPVSGSSLNVSVQSTCAITKQVSGVTWMPPVMSESKLQSRTAQANDQSQMQQVDGFTVSPGTVVHENTPNMCKSAIASWPKTEHRFSDPGSIIHGKPRVLRGNNGSVARSDVSFDGAAHHSLDMYVIDLTKCDSSPASKTIKRTSRSSREAAVNSRTTASMLSPRAAERQYSAAERMATAQPPLTQNHRARFMPPLQNMADVPQPQQRHSGQSTYWTDRLGRQACGYLPNSKGGAVNAHRADAQNAMQFQQHSQQQQVQQQRRHEQQHQQQQQHVKQQHLLLLQQNQQQQEQLQQQLQRQLQQQQYQKRLQIQHNEHYKMRRKQQEQLEQQQRQQQQQYGSQSVVAPTMPPLQQPVQMMSPARLPSPYPPHTPHQPNEAHTFTEYTSMGVIQKRPGSQPPQPLYRPVTPLRFKHSSQYRSAEMYPAEQQHNTATVPREIGSPRRTVSASATFEEKQRPPPMRAPMGAVPNQQTGSPHSDIPRSRMTPLGAAGMNGNCSDAESRPLSNSPASNMAKRRLCERCGRLAFFLCSGCRKVWYCTQQCQMISWNGHSVDCT